MNLSKNTLRWSFIMLFAINFFYLKADPLEIYAVPTLNQQTNILEVDFNVKNFDDLMSMQFSMNWNPNQLSFSDVGAFGLQDLTASNFGTFNSSNGTVTFAWFDTQTQGVNVNDCESIFTLYFDVFSTTSPALSITNNPTAIEITNSDFQLVNLNFFNSQCIGGNGNNDIVAICDIGINVSLANTNPAEATIWATDIDDGSYCLCNEDLTFSFSSDITDQSRVFTCDDLGLQLLQMWVTNESGDQNVCYSEVQIDDMLNVCPSISAAPYASCDNHYVEAPTGCVTVEAEKFNSGSSDDNNQLYYLVAKADNSISSDEFDRCYYPSLEYCDFEADEVEVYFLVLDEDPTPLFTSINSSSLGCNGTPGLFLTDGFASINYDICQSSIKVCNAPVPVAVTCPSPQTVSCDDFTDDLANLIASLNGNQAAQNHALNAYFGKPEFDLPCDFGIDHDVAIDLDQCKQGNIVRSWTAMDLNNPNGNTAWCSQIVFLNHISDFVVEFPEDRILPFGTPIDGAFAGTPQFFNETCELTAVSYEDNVFNEPGFDKKVVRKWTAINWCVVGAFIDDEIIEVPENVLAIPNNDLDGDGDSDERTFRDSWDGVDFPSGISDTWDGYITYTQEILIEEPGNDTAVPYCKNGLVVEVSSNGIIEIWASDIDDGSFCSGGGDVTVSFSPDINDISRIFTCDELGINTIEMWATCTSSGDQDYCTTTVIIQDNLNLCDQPSGDISISGNISEVDGTPLPNTVVTCSFSGFNVNTQTDSNGEYTFLDLPAGETFTITAFSEVDPEKGVTMYDVMLGRCQILWLDLLSTPAAIIALDVNKSGGYSTFDLVMMQKIILGEAISLDYPVWQFISNYDDLDPDQTAYQDQMQAIVLPNLINNTVGHDFTAVKTGDLAPETNPTANVNPIFSLDEITQNGQELTVGLTVKDFMNISAGQFAIQWDNNVLEFVDLALTPNGTPFTFYQNLVNDDLRVTFATMASDPVTIDDDEVVAELTFNILQSGDYQLAFADDSVMPKVIVANNCELAGGLFNTNIPSGDISIGGKVLDKNGNPMQDIEITCQFDVYSIETTTDSDGNYEFTNLPEGESFDISAFSDENPEEGVTIFDIAKGACHILGMNPLQNADEFIAFDVNQSQTNTAFDLVSMRKFILGQDVPSGISIWHFIGNYDDLPNDFSALDVYETNITLDNLMDDAVDQDFTALKAGDIVPETNPSAAYNPSFNLNEVTVNNQQVILDLTVKDFENIRGIQFALEWDTDLLEFAELEQLANPSSGINLNWDFNIVDDKLRLVFQEYLSNDGLTFPNGTALLRLTFNVLELGNTEVAFADNSIMPKLVVANFCDLAGGAFNFTNTPINLLSSTNDLELAGLTAQLRPNLTYSNSAINLIIKAENSTNIQYRMVNISGMEIQTGAANLTSGENTISLTAPKNGGLFFIQIQDEEGRTRQLKLVVH
ncbi:MAG: cohesin domain-containing protein [Bacteroidetes bacterium]|nr:cohesin domain-containing protein [Bacteroidota bacterium]